MHRTLLLTTLLSFVLGLARADEPPSPQDILARALKTHGGEKALAAQNAVTMKGKGTFHGLGQAIPYTGEWAIQGEKQQRFDLEMTIQGQTFPVSQVINGDRGWQKIGPAAAQELKGDKLAEEQMQLHEGWVTRLHPLRDKAFKLSPVGEVQVGNQAALGIRVSRGGRRDVNLFFSKKDGLLLKSETMVKDVDSGKEMTQEILYSDHIDVDGVKHARQVSILRDGKRFVEAEFNEIRATRELPATTFQQP